MTQIFTDQTGRTLHFDAIPKRIVSLVPSQTEFLFDLGLAEHIVGITNYCIHPKELCKKTKKIGGTKDFDFRKIAALAPDLIIGNKEENDKERIEILEKDFAVWLSDIFTLQDNFEMMREIGKITKRESESEKIIAEIEREFQLLAGENFPERRALYFIWKDPYMIAGQKTFIAHMLEKINFCTVSENRYPVFTVENIIHFAPDVILLSSEPYPFKEKHAEELRKIVPNAQVFVVDGEMFSWYGSRLKFSARYFRNLLRNS